MNNIYLAVFKRHSITSLSKLLILLGLSTLCVVYSCRTKEDHPPDPTLNNLVHLPYNPVAYTLPQDAPSMFIPSDNPLTIDGVELGRHLFFDPILSADSTMSCASCHHPELSYTDQLSVSAGIDGISGRRSSMSLLNIGYNRSGFFWDGRSPTLEEQALLPVEDEIELHHHWPALEASLRVHPTYPAMFRAAFGIDDTSEIDKILAAKAIAQYERSLVSFNSKYDKVVRGQAFFEDEESDGFFMFFDSLANVLALPEAECGHCHNVPLFTTNEFFNNGIDTVASLSDFKDKGLGEVTKKLIDNGKFRVTTLRNIALSAPYMHDGRFQTLEEVLDHYNSGGHFRENKSALIRPLGLSAEQQANLIAFLHTLTDTSYYDNPHFFSPF